MREGSGESGVIGRGGIESGEGTYGCEWRRMSCVARNTARERWTSIGAALREECGSGFKAMESERVHDSRSHFHTRISISGTRPVAYHCACEVLHNLTGSASYLLIGLSVLQARSSGTFGRQPDHYDFCVTATFAQSQHNCEIPKQHPSSVLQRNTF
jgi:hypothetical protein